VPRSAAARTGRSVTSRLTVSPHRTENGFFFVLKKDKKRLIQVHLNQYLRAFTCILPAVLSGLIVTHGCTFKITNNQYVPFPVPEAVSAVPFLPRSWVGYLSMIRILEICADAFDIGWALGKLRKLMWGPRLRLETRQGVLWMTSTGTET
jgi:hypothetical protein